MKKKGIFKLSISTFILCVLLATGGFAQQKDFDTITCRIIEDMQRRVAARENDNETGKYLATLQSNGTWPDIDYADKSRTIWAPAAHLSRIQNFALAYTRHGGKYQNSTTLYEAIVNALNAWDQKNPICKNWWYNEINCPQLLGQILLIMGQGKPLSESLKESLMKKIDRGDMYKQTGANKLDVALHNLYSALLSHDTFLMDSAVSQCFQPVCLTRNVEGIQYDYSYFQHGPQLQIAAYGAGFITGEYRVASYVCGTAWQMYSNKWLVLTNYLNRTFLNVIRYKYLDFNVMGRGFSRKDSGKTSTILALRYNIDILKRYYNNTDFTHYTDAVKRIAGDVPPSYHIRPTHIQFWRGDYTLDVRPGYLFSIRSNSINTGRTETGNGENLYGRYMSDGATNIQRRGDEYFNIFPVWEYNKIPGVTCRHYLNDRLAKNAWIQPGTTNFTGGVSDSICGASTYVLNFDSVKAKKAWFFFDKQIVCLGAGIQSLVPENITTTINQCWSHKNVIINKENKSYWQDSIGYYFQPGEQVLMSDTIQKGTWSHINSSQSTDTVSGKVFKLWINHGIQPQNGSYEYIVIPNESAKKFAREMPFSKLKVISNNDEQQAVYSPALHVLQIVFYQAGILRINKIRVSVNKPCVLMLRKTNIKNPELFVADPSQKLKDITVNVNSKKINCQLPLNEYAGATVKYVIK